MTDFLIHRFVKNKDDTHSSVVRTAYGNLAGVVGVVCNLFLCAAKLAIGTLSGSISIAADAINNLSDASSSIITLVGFKLSARPADEEHPYGHARIEYLSGLAVAVMILVIGFELAHTSIDKIIAPTPVEFSAMMVFVLLLSIGVKLWMTAFNRKIGLRIGSTTIEATAMDSRNDVIATTAVLAAAVISMLSGWNLDGWMGLAVALFILYSGVGIIKDTLNPLLGAAPDQKLVQSIAKKILSYPGVLGTHDLMVHDYGPGARFGSVHVEMAAEESALKSHDIIDNIERDFLENDHFHLVIHYDPIVTGDEALGTKREWVKQLVQRISPQLSMHDFRMVTGESHTNLIFDVVMPAGFVLSEEELKHRIQKQVRQEDSMCYAVVTVDTGYAGIQHENEEKEEDEDENEIAERAAEAAREAREKQEAAK
ncbi:MAG: cation diffusion facilitator family transporter [Ruthenibacterium sp.]